MLFVFNLRYYKFFYFEIDIFCCSSYMHVNTYIQTYLHTYIRALPMIMWKLKYLFLSLQITCSLFASINCIFVHVYLLLINTKHVSTDQMTYMFIYIHPFMNTYINMSNPHKHFVLELTFRITPNDLQLVRNCYLSLSSCFSSTIEHQPCLTRPSDVHLTNILTNMHTHT